jgi:hypothetical protein
MLLYFSLILRGILPDFGSDWFFDPHRCYYHRIRPHRTLREPCSDERWSRRDRTPAMALGLTDHVWTVEEIILTPILTRLACSDPAVHATGALAA